MSDSPTFLIDREKIDIGLFQQANYKLHDIALFLSSSVPFVEIADGETVAQCLLEDKGSYMDITHSAYKTEGALIDLLLHIVEYYKAQGKASVEIGCGNADVGTFALLQRIGFRVIGVRTDFFLSDLKTVNVENGIANIDMIRLSTNLKAKGLSTIGHDASGRT